MVKKLKLQEQHIAVFGESGSGKTVLASSFYGAAQEKTSKSEPWDLVADDIGLGRRLHQNYLGMRDDARTPAQNRFKATTYRFTVKMKTGGDAKAATKQPFDGLRLVWHDYPGEWFEVSTSSDDEAVRRVDTFRALLQSDVALVLVDGQKLLEHRGEEERYLASLFTNIKQGLLHIREDVLRGEGPLAEFPRIWIIALSKADLFADWDVYRFRDLVLVKSGDHIEHLLETLKQFVDTPDALSLGEDFLRLSSAEFMLSSASPAPVEIDVTKRVGLDLILPVASILPLQRVVQWQEKLEVPRQVLDKVADGAEALARVLTGGKRALVAAKILGKITPLGPVGAKFGPQVLAFAVKTSVSQLKQINEQARAKNDHLTATLTQFQLDLEQGEADGRLIRAK